MEPPIRPEPNPEERAAILAALEELAAGDGAPPAYRSAWREVGIRENVENLADLQLERPAGDERDPQGAKARPRSSPGATRA